ncbi:MAG: DUF5683 domain-containing protein [Cyclobacteriaceae bacterium]|nr:DUF5683 domain-containing protein [Cyclobacteriaceae bacterium]
MITKTYILFFGLVLQGLFVLAQNNETNKSDVIVVTDSLHQEKKTEINQTTSVSTHDPRKAFWYSAILPGLGQAYNQKYWKMPLVYGGFFFLGYQISNYNAYNIRFKNMLHNTKNPDYQLPQGYTKESVERNIERALRERDYMVVWTAAFYFIQIADAHIDAHLKDFELNPDLHVKLGPSLEPLMGSSMSAGIGITFKIAP